MKEQRAQPKPEDDALPDSATYLRDLQLLSRRHIRAGSAG